MEVVFYCFHSWENKVNILLILFYLKAKKKKTNIIDGTTINTLTHFIFHECSLFMESRKCENKLIFFFVNQLIVSIRLKYRRAQNRYSYHWGNHTLHTKLMLHIYRLLTETQTVWNRIRSRWTYSLCLSAAHNVNS